MAMRCMERRGGALIAELLGFALLDASMVHQVRAAAQHGNGG